MAYVEKKIRISNWMPDGKYPHDVVTSVLCGLIYDLMKVDPEVKYIWFRGWDGSDGITYTRANRLYARLLKVQDKIVANPKEFTNKIYFKRIKGHWKWDFTHEDMYEQALVYLDYLLRELEPYKNSDTGVEIL